MNKVTVKDIAVSGKRVLVRVDFNVPLDKKMRHITDDSRIQAALPTIRYLIEQDVRVIVISHLGRPKGRVVDKLRLNIVAQRLSQLLGQQVGVATDCIGPEVENSVASLQSGDVLLLENLRFHSDEETGSASFAQSLARLADIFVNDAFGTSHRAHASIVGIANYLPAVAGFLLEKEIDTLNRLLKTPIAPFAALLGGAKISDKVGMLQNIMHRVDTLLIGGGMAATFLKARIYEVGQSLIEEEMLPAVTWLMNMAEKNGVKLLLPVDVVVADNNSAKSKIEVVSVDNITKNKRIMDIGPQTIRNFRKELRRCRTIFWNGPMGVYEVPRFAKGTRAMARLLAGMEATSVIGGGSTAEAVTELDLVNDISFVSTGGGASLKFLGGESLPGVESLLNISVPLDRNLEILKSIAKVSPSKIVFIVMDGLGGLANPQTGKTATETARTPNFDKLSAQGICGLIDMVGPGITPGSAPGHLSLFGYDPTTYNIGRGALESVGIDFDLEPSDVAARGNFCTIDSGGLVTDRRAGRITTEQCSDLCQLINGLVIDNVEVFVRPVKEHRFIAVFRGDGITPDIGDSDPQQIGVTPKVVVAIKPNAMRMANIVNQFISHARRILADRSPANMILLRGFSQHPLLPTLDDIYKLNPAVIALYPMYRGLARLIGMEVLPTGTTLKEQIATLRHNYLQYDFFFLHIKGTDAGGEDGDFDQKVQVIEQVDSILPEILSLKPEVVVVTGDHSTPAILKGHSWHPVPCLLFSEYCRPDQIKRFAEPDFVLGGLGRLPATKIMPLAMANAFKLDKYGA